MIYRGWIRPSQLKIIDTFGDSHWESFERTRRKHNDNICEETNKLVLRLDKLINAETAADSAGTKTGSNNKRLSNTDLDKSLVAWTSDDLVKLCPYCARAFTFARRRHHCRLCGAIQCSSCSHYLEYKAACRLVKPAKLYTDPYDRIEDQLEAKSAEEKPRIRTCEDCQRLLDKRVQIIEDYYSQPTFLSIYEELRKSISEADELMLSQSSLISPSVQKETTLELKGKIQEFRQRVAMLSSRIKRWIEREPSAKQAYLLNAINQSIAYWLKESLDSKANRVYGSQQATGRLASGWVPEDGNSQRGRRREIDENENPLLIQIRNLEDYIKQARAADRYEEVSALEANKRDLEIEYFIQQDVASTSMSMASLNLADDENDDHQERDNNGEVSPTETTTSTTASR